MNARAIVDTPEEAARQEQPPLLVRDAVRAYLDEHGLGSGPLEAETIGEGHSNVTYALRRGERRFVLRRPPRPPLPPSAHDVLREARLLRALEPTPVPTPRVLATCEDESLLGVPFYVMEHLDGEVITDRMPPALDRPDVRAGLADELVDALVALHAVDHDAVGLEAFGKPSGYLARQLRRFAGLWDDTRTREVPALDEVTGWLGQHLPDSPPATIVHGDFRLGNVMFAATPPARVVALFDWELATIGDPLADLGYLTATWAQPDDPEGVVMFELSAVTRLEGFPGRDELVARYAERSGRSVADLRWYQALALWKSAIFLEGSFRRFQAGSTDDPWFASLDEGVPRLAEAARAAAQQPAPG